MNCSQARALLAIYRDLKHQSTDTFALEAHLAYCDACKDAFAQSQFVGERIRSMPSIEPSSDAHTRLMQALAAEHVRFLQRTPSSAASIPTPAFLAPHLHNVARTSSRAHNLVAFSTADTGPLPIVQVAKTRHRPRHLNHISILGLAASFLIVIMAGGLMSLSLLSSNSPSTEVHGNNSAIVVKPSFIYPESYTKTAVYPHVASAVANDDHIYYTTYNEDASYWMLENISTDNKSPESTPLLSQPRTAPVILLGASKDWLVWLQVDKPKKSTDSTAAHPLHTNPFTGTWSVHALRISTPVDSATNVSQTIQLHKNTFDLNTVPGWITTPVQGVSFYQDHILLATVDAKGTSHLYDYALSPKGVQKTTEVASGKDGHILTSPTNNGDGSLVYWSEEWQQEDETLASNIWTRQDVEAQPERQGRWAAHIQTDTYLFRDDEHSFRPQLVGDTLFLLDRGANQTATAPKPAKPTVTTTVTPATRGKGTQATVTPKTPTPVAITPTPTSVNTTLLGGSTRVDPAVYTPQLDTLLTGKLLAFSANGALPIDIPVKDKPVSALQGGKRFLIWQNEQKNFEMYDVVARTSVIVNQNDIPKDAAFLAVNGDTAVWSRYVSIDPTTNPVATDTDITFGTFKWPKASGN